MLRQILMQYTGFYLQMQQTERVEEAKHEWFQRQIVQEWSWWGSCTTLLAFWMIPNWTPDHPTPQDYHHYIHTRHIGRERDNICDKMMCNTWNSIGEAVKVGRMMLKNKRYEREVVIPILLCSDFSLMELWVYIDRYIMLQSKKWNEGREGNLDCNFGFGNCLGL